MKSIVFYAIKPGSGFAGPYWPVHPQGGRESAIYIRAQVVEGDITEALDKATPLENEIVLNSIPLA